MDKKNAKSQGSFTYWTERYYGSETNITTVYWRGKGEVDSDAVIKWCNKSFGPSGYRDEEETTYWVDNSDNGEIMICKDELLTAFLLKWT